MSLTVHRPLKSSLTPIFILQDGSDQGPDVDNQSVLDQYYHQAPVRQAPTHQAFPADMAKKSRNPISVRLCTSPSASIRAMILELTFSTSVHSV